MDIFSCSNPELDLLTRERKKKQPCSPIPGVYIRGIDLSGEGFVEAYGNRGKGQNTVEPCCHRYY